MVVNIAKNIITLSAINDAFSVLFSPNTCVIKADYDGNNPQLNSAYTDVSLKRGEKRAKYELTYKTSSNSGIAYRISVIDEYTKRIQLIAIPKSTISGYLIFDIKSDEGYDSTITFQFSVIRESTMLDWIQDWENNKTTIGSTYLITPKIFVGKKVVNEAGLNSLTGVYIGPDAASAGIYGYKEGEDIFHINENGGSIGGWEIDTKGIQSSDRLFKILSEGTIKVEDNSGEIIWAIQKGGDATFSKGKVRLNGDGSAYFEGNITSISGNIGGWSLGENLLHSDYLVLDSSRHYIGISPFDLSTLEEIDNAFNHKSYVKEKGGVCMFYTSANSYGIEGYLPVAAHSDEARQVFSLGSTNQISGWNMSEKKLASTHVVLVSDDIASGIYMSTTDISQTSPSSIVSAIEENSGIYLYSTEHEAKLVGQKDGKTIFSLSSINDSIIAGWKFNEDAIFKGTLVNSGFTKSSGDITISSQGIRGYKWRLDADGNGAIADGEIYWDMDGVHFGENVKLSWNNFSDEAKNDMQNGLLPDWVNDWDKVENKTEIGGEYVVSPKIFSGKRDQETGKLTGIVLGRDCLIEEDGTKRTGIFALLNDEIVFELDPINKKYKFKGEVIADSGVFNGTVNADSGTFNGTVNADRGSIGGFEIASGRIGSEVNTEYGGGQLAIYNNLIRVGNSDSYSLLGGDTIPATAGGAYTSTCRFVNNTKKDSYNGANYGMMINVSGAKRNYGIKSDAPILATSCIGMKIARPIYWVNYKSDDGKEFDFSKYSVYLIASDRYMGLNLPDESTVASYFGLTSLPSDFSLMFTLHVRHWSYDIRVNNVYDWNANLINIDMVKGDSLTLLISKYDGFRYDVLNRQD
jgi:hypothetical protein